MDVLTCPCPYHLQTIPESKVHGVMSAPDGPHVGPTLLTGISVKRGHWWCCHCVIPPSSLPIVFSIVEPYWWNVVPSPCHHNVLCITLHYPRRYYKAGRWMESFEKFCDAFSRVCVWGISYVIHVGTHFYEFIYLSYVFQLTGFWLNDLCWGLRDKRRAHHMFQIHIVWSLGVGVIYIPKRSTREWAYVMG